MTFNDEFEGTLLDTGKWSTAYRWGRKNPPELQYYAPDAFELQNGILRIRAERRQMAGLDYTSGLIATHNNYTFTYGYVETRARIPAGKGFWPAFWLLSDNPSSSNEIDAMENLGHEPRRVYATLHYDGPSGDVVLVSHDYVGPDFSAAFHTFGMRWDPSAVIWYVDGVERFRVTDHVPQKPMYVIANLAVGGEWPGNPDSSTVFPAYFDIDYVRVYQSK